MKNQDLIARYIYAVVRHLPKKTRSDVEKEIDALISDMLEKKCGNDTATENDIKAVLIDLGTPEELAAKYSGDEDGQKVLISGVNFINYKKILKLVIPIVVGAVLLGMTIATITEIASGLTQSTGLFIFRTFGQTLGGVTGGALQAFAIITLIFAILERYYKNVKVFDDDDFLLLLPEVPSYKKRIEPYESIFGIIVAVAVPVLFLGFPQIMGGRLDGVWTPVFDVDVLRSLWLPIILWAVFGIIGESVTIIEGLHTKRLATVTVITNLLIIGCAAIVFLGSSVLNPDFVQNISAILNDEGIDFVITLLSNFHIAVFAILCIIVIAESVSAVVNAMRR